MGKLIISAVSGASSEHELKPSRTRIGRHPDNDIQLSDKTVSGSHALIEVEGTQTFFEDLNSSNGSLVNGKRVSRQLLQSGDKIKLGRVTMRFVGERSVAAQGEGQTHSGAHSTHTTVPVHGKLQVSDGVNKGRELELSKPLTTIGKPGVQVAALTRREEGFYLSQVGNGSGFKPILLNGVAMGAQTQKLQDGDQLELMNTRLTFVLIR